MTVTGPNTDGVTVPEGSGSTPDPAERPERLGLAAQLVRFVVIGGLAALVDLGVYQLLVAVDLWAPAAKGISFILGTTTAYLLNRRFTFASSAGGRGKFMGFLLLYGSTFVVNVAVASLVLWWLQAPTVGTPPLAAFLSWFVAQACATTITFGVMRFVLFRD